MELLGIFNFGESATVPSPEYEKFYQGAIRKLERAPAVKMSIQEQRKSFEDSVGSYEADPDIQLQRSHLGAIPVLEVAAPKIQRQNTILFFHGGGYRVGSSWSHRDLMGRLSRASHSLVIGVDYRLAPEHPFPAALEDGLAAYQALLQKVSSSKHLSLVGVSAGGGLALALMLALKQRNEPLPACYVGICPWVDLTLSGVTLETNRGKDLITKERLKEARDAYCQNHDPKAPFISPTFGDLSHLPPLLIQAGGREVLLSEIESLAQRAKKQGTSVHYEQWPDMLHAWHLFSRDFPEGREAIQKIGDWMIRHHR